MGPEGHAKGCRCLQSHTRLHRWGGLWLAATNKVAMPLPVVVVCGLAASMANCWFDTADIATALKNFSAHGGDVAGALLQRCAMLPLRLSPRHSLTQLAS